MKIFIDMTESDFHQLVESSTYWRRYYDREDKPEYSWRHHVASGRFEYMQGNHDLVALTDEGALTPRPDWEMAYFLPDDWTAVMLCRTWLDTLGEPYEILFDLAQAASADLSRAGMAVIPGNLGHFLILTNWMDDNSKARAREFDGEKVIGLRRGGLVKVEGHHGVGRITGWTGTRSDDYSTWGVLVEIPGMPRGGLPFPQAVVSKFDS